MACAGAEQVEAMQRRRIMMDGGMEGWKLDEEEEEEAEEE